MGSEPVQLVRADRMVRELLAGLLREGAEAVVVELLERGADDPEAGHQPGLGEVEHAGQELPPGQVAGGPEEDDDVGVERRQRGDLSVARALG